MGILIILYYNNLKIHDPVAQLSMLIMISPMCNTVFYGRHHDLINHCGISLSEMTTNMFHLS